MTQKPDWMISHSQPWAVVEERTVYDNPWMTLAEYDAIAPTGAATLYGVVRFKNMALVVLPLHDDGTVTLVGQHRFAIPGYSWEAPAGGGTIEAVSGVMFVPPCLSLPMVTVRVQVPDPNSYVPKPLNVIASAVGPVISARIRDHATSYSSAFLPYLVVLPIGAIVMLGLRRARLR